MRPQIVLITDPALGDDAIVRCVETVALALPRGTLCVQIRDKRRPLVSLRVFASRLRVVTRKLGAWLVVNGNASVARDIGADGVHLGREGEGVAAARAVFGRPGWISVAAHSDADVSRAVDDEADAVLVSPIFPTRPLSPMAPSKEARGLDAIRAARAIARGRLAVYALGGVTPARALACAQAGADGVAVVRAFLGSAAPAAVARALYGTLRRLR